MDNIQKDPALSDSPDKGLFEALIPQLRADLKIIQTRTELEHDDVFYVEILKKCHALKESIKKTEEATVHKAVECFETVIELIRRKKVDHTEEVFDLLNTSLLFLDGIHQPVQETNDFKNFITRCQDLKNRL